MLSERTCPGRQLDPETLGDHVARLYRAAKSLCGSREESEELVQETFARVLRKPRMLHSPDDLEYLLRTLRNTFISTRRAASSRPRRAAHSDLLDLLEDPNAAQPEARITTGELFAVIAALPPDFRDAVVAIDVIGLSTARPPERCWFARPRSPPGFIAAANGSHTHSPSRFPARDCPVVARRDQSEIGHA